jgi:hypothetical protein
MDRDKGALVTQLKKQKNVAEQGVGNKEQLCRSRYDAAAEHDKTQVQVCQRVIPAQIACAECVLDVSLSACASQASSGVDVWPRSALLTAHALNVAPGVLRRRLQ